ncbi:MAG: hypothetical protein WCH37_10785, partial [Synechococcaceae cyanobacterium ELA182]
PDQRGAKSEGMTGNPEIVATNGGAISSQGGGRFGVVAAAGLSLGLKNQQLTRQLIALLKGELSSIATFCTLEELSPGDKEHRKEIILAQGIDPLGHLQ